MSKIASGGEATGEVQVSAELEGADVGVWWEEDGEAEEEEHRGSGMVHGSSLENGDLQNLRGK